MDDLPPCIVWGLETQIGLNIVRELGQAGVRVVGITHDANAIGLRSRHLWRSVVVKQPRSLELQQVLVRLGDELGECCLIAVSESNLVWLGENIGNFGRVSPILPPVHALQTVLDKRKTLAVARKLGLMVPSTEHPQTAEDIRRVATTFRFPAVLKWSDPIAAAPVLHAHGIAFEKAEYAYTAAEFELIAARYAPAGIWPLVQQYCPGYGLGQFFYIHQGEPIRRFQHRRIAEWPPEGGFSSVCDGVPLSQHEAVQERSVDLLQAIDWSGVAMVEYRYDEQTGEAWLMEINGRFWGSFPLAVYSNAGFALLSYRLHSGLPAGPLPRLRENVRCRMVATELKRLARILFQPSRIANRDFPVHRGAELWRFVSDFFSLRVRYYVWSIHDPRPFLADFANLFRRMRR